MRGARNPVHYLAQKLVFPSYVVLLWCWNHQGDIAKPGGYRKKMRKSTHAVRYNEDIMDRDVHKAGIYAFMSQVWNKQKDL
jgi:hypothetical protein